MVETLEKPTKFHNTRNEALASIAISGADIRVRVPSRDTLTSDDLVIPPLDPNNEELFRKYGIKRHYPFRSSR